MAGLVEYHTQLVAVGVAVELVESDHQAHLPDQQYLAACVPAGALALAEVQLHFCVGG